MTPSSSSAARSAARPVASATSTRAQRSAEAAPQGYFHEEPLSFDYPPGGQDGVALRPLDVPAKTLEEALPSSLRRRDGLADLPQLSEFEVVRHFTRLSKWNVSIDAAMYPLGSCTMKYNPRINERIARLPGLSEVHPALPAVYTQGWLALFHQLERWLCEVTGFDAASLQPLAGAQGELCGVMLIRAYHEDRQENRQIMLVPDSAHGTNPASASLAGYRVEEVPSDHQGRIDVATLAQKMTTNCAGLMLTNPNTLGIFEDQIDSIAEIVHSRGGLVYCDGANMNAQVGIVRPAAYGMDVMHLNLHKTFSTPHGGGGPGAGPCLCTAALEPYLPVPRVRLRSGESASPQFELHSDAPRSIGRLAAFYGNAGVLARALSFILALGGQGLRTMTEVAVLNANYLRQKLENQLTLATNAPTLHEVVFTDASFREKDVTTMQIAKRLMDYGFHPPTVYFPLTVAGALMIEPTESEPQAELDRFIEAIEAILTEVDDDPQLVREAPHLAPRQLLDEASAARKPRLRWQRPIPAREASSA